REEHPSASVPVILRTLVAEGRLEPDAISASSVRRFYQEKGLDRVAVRNQARGKVRLRWQAERPGALWHADVCHGTAVVIDARSLPVRIHGILDDASRYVIALEAFHHERESELLTLLVRAVRKHGPADALYLDNGATYRGRRSAWPAPAWAPRSSTPSPTTLRRVGKWSATKPKTARLTASLSRGRGGGSACAGGLPTRGSSRDEKSTTCAAASYARLRVTTAAARMAFAGAISSPIGSPSSRAANSTAAAPRGETTGRDRGREANVLQVVGDGCGNPSLHQPERTSKLLKIGYMLRSGVERPPPGPAGSGFVAPSSRCPKSQISGTPLRLVTLKSSRLRSRRSSRSLASRPAPASMRASTSSTRP